MIGNIITELDETVVLDGSHLYPQEQPENMSSTIYLNWLPKQAVFRYAESPSILISLNDGSRTDPTYQMNRPREYRGWSLIYLVSYQP